MTPCYLFSFNNEGYITRINIPLLNDLGYQSTEVVNVFRLEQLLTVGSKIFFQTHFYPIIKLHEKANEIFLSFKTKDNIELPVLLNVQLIRDLDQFEVHCGGMQISQRNRFEKEILEAKRIAENALVQNDELINLKAEIEGNQVILESRLRTLAQKNNEQRQMSTIFSHDMQEPLRKISILTDLLLNEGIEDEKTRDSHLIRMSAAVGKMRRLVVSMQQFLAMDTKEITISDSPLAKIFIDAQIKAQLDSKAVFIEVVDELPIIEVDNLMFVNLLYELLMNSIKFQDPQKEQLKITLSAEQVAQNVFIELENRYKYEDFIRITYRDNGLGFENKYSSEVFNMFRKAHNIQEGNGIGLAYCRKIIELHHGTIKVSSEIGIGTTFTVLIPAKQL